VPRARGIYIKAPDFGALAAFGYPCIHTDGCSGPGLSCLSAACACLLSIAYRLEAIYISMYLYTYMYTYIYIYTYMHRDSSVCDMTHLYVT